MAIIFYPDLKWAAGWNNAAGLVTVESTLNKEGLFPYTFTTYDPGIRETTGDGGDYDRGHDKAEIVFTVFHWEKHIALMTLFGAGVSYNGKATVRIPTNNPTSYANYNCWIKLPRLTEPRSEPKVLYDYIIKVTRLIAI